MKINEFTIYNDLDHLLKDITRVWGVISARRSQFLRWQGQDYCRFVSD